MQISPSSFRGVETGEKTCSVFGSQARLESNWILVEKTIFQLDPHDYLYISAWIFFFCTNNVGVPEDLNSQIEATSPFPVPRPPFSLLKFPSVAHSQCHKRIERRRLRAGGKAERSPATDRGKEIQTLYAQDSLPRHLRRYTTDTSLANRRLWVRVPRWSSRWPPGQIGYGAGLRT